MQKLLESVTQMDIQMKTLFSVFIVGLFVLGATPCKAEGGFSSDYFKEYIMQDNSTLDTRVDRVYIIYAIDREGLIKAMPIPPGQTATIYLGERKIELKTWPMGSIYGGNGRWFIKYEENHNYMDIWKIEGGKK